MLSLTHTCLAHIDFFFMSFPKQLASYALKYIMELVSVLLIVPGLANNKRALHS